VQWLAARNQSSGWIWGALVVVTAVWLIAFLRTGGTGMAILVFVPYTAISLHELLKFCIAWEATRRFSEARRDSTLESLLSTPLSLLEIMRGHVDALYNQFVAPVSAVLILDLVLVSWI